MNAYALGATIGVLIGIGTAAMGYSVLRPKSPPDVGQSPLPPMRRVAISDSEPGPLEHVRGFRVFQAGDCTVWRFVDSVGVHYLAEGRSLSSTPISCGVAR